MRTNNQVATVSKTALWAGRVISLLLVLMLLMSAAVKILRLADVGTEFARLNYPDSLILGIGILEVVCTVLYVIPNTAVLGAILLTGYLGGATATHLRIGDPYYGPVILGVLVWIGLYLRDNRLRALIPLRRTTSGR